MSTVFIIFGCIPAEDELNLPSSDPNTFRIIPDLAHIAPSQSIRLSIEGGTPPFQVSTPSIYGSANLLDSSTIIVDANNDGNTGSIPITIVDLTGQRTSANIHVSNSFSYTPISREIYPGRKSQITITNGPNPPYTFKVIEGQEYAQVNSEGLVSISPGAPTDRSLAVIRITDSKGLNEESYFTISDKIDADTIEMGLSSSHTCLGKIDEFDHEKNLQCWGALQYVNSLGHQRGIWSNPLKKASEMPLVSITHPSGRRPTKITMGAYTTCATFENGSNYSDSIMCWGNFHTAGGSAHSGARPNSLSKIKPQFFKGFKNEDGTGDEIALYIKELTTSTHDGSMCVVLTEKPSSDGAVTGSGEHEGEVRCWGTNKYSSDGSRVGRLGTN